MSSISLRVVFACAGVSAFLANASASLWASVGCASLTSTAGLVPALHPNSQPALTPTIPQYPRPRMPKSPNEAARRGPSAASAPSPHRPPPATDACCFTVRDESPAALDSERLQEGDQRVAIGGRQGHHFV